MGKEQEVESLSIRMSIDTSGVIAGLTAVNNLFNKISANAYATTAEVNRMLFALGELSRVNGEGIGVGRPGEPSPVPNQPRVEPPETPRPTVDPVTPPPETPRPTAPVAPTRQPVLPRSAGTRLDYTTRRWVNRIKRLLMPLVAAFGARALWKGFNDGVKMIDTYRKQIGMSTSELDKWAKANQYAGGSQKALLDTMAKFVKETGQSADEFIEMMLHVNELSKSEQEAFLKTKGYSEEAVAIFLKSDDEIINILSHMKEIAFTDKDIQSVKGFNEQWNKFKILAQGIGNIFIQMIYPVFSGFLKIVTALGEWAVKHQTTFKVLTGLLTLAFGNVLVRQMAAGQKAGGLLINVFKALTRGVFSFSRALLASPLTWYLLALGAIYLVLEDIYYFITGGESVIGDILNEWFGAEFTETVKKDLKELFEYFTTACEAIGEFFGEFGGVFKDVGRAIWKVEKTILKALFLIIAAVLMAIPYIGKIIGQSIGWLVVNVPKAWEKIVNAVKGWWEDLKQGASDIWNGIKDVISGVIDEIVKIFENMWKSACDYIDKTVNKLKELNPFQEWAEEKGSQVFDFFNGNPTAAIVGTHALPTRNVHTEQTNNITINTNETGAAVVKGVNQATKQLDVSFTGQN